MEVGPKMISLKFLLSYKNYDFLSKFKAVTLYINSALVLWLQHSEFIDFVFVKKAILRASFLFPIFIEW